MCHGNTGIETTNHLLLRDHFYTIVEQKLYSNIYHIRPGTHNLADNCLVMLTLYGSNNHNGYINRVLKCNLEQWYIFFFLLRNVHPLAMSVLWFWSVLGLVICMFLRESNVLCLFVLKSWYRKNEKSQISSKNPAQIEEQKQTVEIVKNVNVGFLTKAKQKLTIPK